MVSFIQNTTNYPPVTQCKGICQTTAAGNSAEPDSDEGDPDTQRGRKRKDAESLERYALWPSDSV